MEFWFEETKLGPVVKESVVPSALVKTSFIVTEERDTFPVFITKIV